MLFEKASLRTRVSFQVAMIDLGGYAIYLKPDDIGIIGKREPAKDMARVLEPLCPRHHGPDLRPRDDRRIGPLRDGAGDQRPQRLVASLSGDGGHDDHPGTSAAN